MAKAQRYSMEQTLAAQKCLRALTTKMTGKTKAEVVDFLAADIRKAVAQGHSLEDIQEVLGKAGIAVPFSRMKAVLKRAAEKGMEREVETAPAVNAANSGNEPVSAKIPDMEEATTISNSASPAKSTRGAPVISHRDYGLSEL
jgi:ribosomal protein L12E/L44/L45/RPP1/RPP2